MSLGTHFLFTFPPVHHPLFSSLHGSPPPINSSTVELLNTWLKVELCWFKSCLLKVNEFMTSLFYPALQSSCLSTASSSSQTRDDLGVPKMHLSPTAESSQLSWKRRRNYINKLVTLQQATSTLAKYWNFLCSF